jgi:putative protease
LTIDGDGEASQSDEVGGAVYEVFDGSGRMLGAKEQVHTGIVELTFAKGMRLNGVMAGDIVWRTSDPTLEGRIHAAATAGPARGGIRQRDENGVTAVFQGAVGQLLRLTLVDPLGHAGSATSTMELAVASARPVDEAALSKALGEQLGGGPLHLATLDTSALDLAAGLFLPAKEVKQMRRDAVTQLLARRTEHGRAAQLRQQGDAGPSETAVLMEELRPVAGDGEAAGASTIGDAAARITVLCRTRAQVEAALQVDWLDEVIVDFLEVQGLKEACESVRQQNELLFVGFSRCLRAPWAYALTFPSEHIAHTLSHSDRPGASHVSRGVALW